MVISSLDPLTIHLYRDALVLVAPDEYSADVAYDNDMAKHLSSCNFQHKWKVVFSRAGCGGLGWRAIEQ